LPTLVQGTVASSNATDPCFCSNYIFINMILASKSFYSFNSQLFGDTLPSQSSKIQLIRLTHILLNFQEL